MLKKMSIRKLMVATLTLFILMILYMMPDSLVKNEINIENDNVEYIEPNDLAVVYLLDSNEYIARTKINTSNTKDTIEECKNLIDSLIIDGSYSSVIPNGFRSIIPSGTKILDIELTDNILTINFSKELLEVKKEYEEKMIESLIYTLTSIDKVDKIIIKVENNNLDKLPHSKKLLPKILDKSFGINKVYNISNRSNIDYFTIYYVNTYNDNNYYVPVTKYINNDSQDKIKVIIEQLSTAPIYESNLMSFLDVSTKLIDYKLKEDSIRLNFNNSILTDVTNNNILEEVIYTISLSMEDNYNIKEVVFCINDKEIYKSFIKEL